jgi:asparagine synthase (glutamine-hydrolysing)
MSAIGGIYNFDDAPIDGQLLATLGSRLNARGPDGGSQVLFTSIGMAYRAFHTNKESRLEKQPLVSPNKLLLCWDGRLDNREELISLLRSDLQGVHTDVSIVMAAYVKWGLDFLPRIIGDFALSLWDPRARMLLLARDPIGPRTLYYHADEQSIIWTTELGPLLDLTSIRQEVNDDYIADYLTRLPDPSQTPYKNIHAVPPAHVVIVSTGRLRLQRFWGLNPNSQIRYRTDAEYEEHFRHLFRDAVRCRLRVEGAAWAELSGGLDSSSIVCMANDVIKSGEAVASNLETVSSVFDEASKSDERKYINYVEEKIGRKGLHLREDDYRLLAPVPVNPSHVVPNPLANFAEYYNGLNESMAKAGARVLLSGKGGDEILNAALDPGPKLADLLVQCRPLQLHRCLTVWTHALKKQYLELLWQKTIVPVLPQNIRSVFQRRPGFKMLDLYDHTFVKRMKLHERKLGPTDIFGFRYPSGRDRSIWFLRIVRELSAGYWQEFTNAEMSYPFTHRPLVEFMQAIPFEQSVRPGQTRSLLRRALRNLLPTEIAQRKGKRVNTDAVLRAVAREWPRLRSMFTDACICKYGYIDRESLLAMLAVARQGSDLASSAVTFLIPLEYWLLTFEGRRSVASLKAIRKQSELRKVS